MSKSNSTEARRKLLFAGGAGLLGIPAVLTAWMAKVRGKGRAEAQARRLIARLDLPKDQGGMLKAFAQDPEKIERYRELTRWRKERDEELRKV